MDVSPKSGETLIVCHIHGRSVGWNLYNSVQTFRRPPSLNLTHSISLPERGDLPREALHGGLSHTNKSSSTETVDKKGTENCRGYKSSPTLGVLSEYSPSTSPQIKNEPTHCRGTPRWQNVFIPESEMNEDEEDDDSDGDNLHKYHEGSSLQLQGNLTQCNKIPFSQAKEIKDRDCRDSRGTPVLMDCDEQDWRDEEDFSKHTLEESDNWAPTEHLIESITQNQTDYITDSSCNSSDGVLVNFSAIYNKTNNAVPATPLNLDSPVLGSGTVLQDGSNPLPSWSSHNIDPNCNIYPFSSDGLPSTEISDITMCLQSQARLAGSTQNYYKLVTCDLSSQSTPSPPWSSLTSFSETHSQGSCSPPSEYFLFAHSEGEEKEKAKFDQSEHQVDGNIEMKNPRQAIKDKSKGTKERKAHIKIHQSTSREHDNWSSMKTPQSQSWVGSQKSSVLLKRGALQNSCPSHLDTHLSSPLSRQHATSFAEIARCKKGNGESSMKINDPSSSHVIHKLSSIQKQDYTEIPAESLSTDSSSQYNPEGACASSPETVRYTKAQRPTFLPIQPFVLQAPSGKQQNKALGSLLNQYISHKYSMPGPSKATCKSKAHPHDMQPSPLGSSSNIHLEAATSSDTCSTCTSSPILPHIRPQCSQPCTLLGLIHQDLMNRNPLMSPNNSSPQSPEQKDRSPIACSSQTILSQKYSCSGKASQNCLPEQTPLVSTQTSTPSVLREEITGSLVASHPLQQSSSPAITSVTSLTSITSLISLPSTGRKSLCPFETESRVCTNEQLNTNAHQIFEPKRSSCVVRERQYGDSFSMTDKPPEEFCLSPEAPSDLLSIDLLHKRSILKAVSLAVNLITAHFNSSSDPDEKIRLGNSSLCATISHLVLKQLYPTIQNILQDGLRTYKLDLIIGQRRNKLWNVIEAMTQPGLSTQLPDSLVSVVKKCSQLSSRVRLSVFITELLNLRALDFWILNLYSCIDVVTEHYHQWGFLALAQGPIYGPLFQELLLLLQPLSLLPFDLHLPFESNLKSQEKSKLRAALPYRLLPQSAQILQMSSIQKSSRSPTGQNAVGKMVTDDFWLNQMPTSQSRTQEKEEEETGMENSEMTQSSTSPLNEMRWARLFGSGVGTPVGPQRTQKNISGPLRSRRPSEWLKLGASKVDLLAQSVWTKKWTHLSGNHDRDIADNDEILTLKSPQEV